MKKIQPGDPSLTNDQRLRILRDKVFLKIAINQAYYDLIFASLWAGPATTTNCLLLLSTCTSSLDPFCYGKLPFTFQVSPFVESLTIVTTSQLAFAAKQCAEPPMGWNSSIEAHRPAHWRNWGNVMTPSARFSPNTQVGKALICAWRHCWRPASSLSHST